MVRRSSFQNKFEPEQNLKIYLDNAILKSVNTDEQGNFLTTISIPDTQNAGRSEFIVKDESENIQTTIVDIGEAENRFLKTTKFEISGIPAEVRFDETLTITGSAYPQSAVIIKFEDADRVLEKIRVVKANSNGEWTFEEMIDRNETIGEKYVIIKNNNDVTTKNLDIKSDYLVEISTSAIRYNQGETVIVTGNSEPNKNTTIWIKDKTGKIIHYNVFESKSNGELDYEFIVDDSFDIGTYTMIIKQESGGADASFFGIGKYPSPSIIGLMEKSNFALNSKAILTAVGPSSTKLSVKLLDSNDNIKITDSITTSSTGKSRYSMDLTDLSSGIYRAVIGALNVQDSVKFSIGLEPGSGDISLITTQENYIPGESIIVIGNTGSNARLMITLYAPSGSTINTTEIFSDGSGNFSTDEIGIPTTSEFGVWKLTAHSRLDSTTIDINVALPTQDTIKLDIDDTEFSINDIIMIKGSASSNSSHLEIDIINTNDEVVVSLQTPITGDDTFSLPWTIPADIPSGTYTITVTDGTNSDSNEILIL